MYALADMGKTIFPLSLQLMVQLFFFFFAPLYKVYVRTESHCDPRGMRNLLSILI